MKLNKILKGIKILNATMIKNVNILNIGISTNQNLANGLYICLKGQNFDGHNFMQEAKKCGAVAFLVEEINYDFDGLQILVEDTRSALSYVAKNFYKYDNSLKVIGVTGTNGKTTTTSILKSILENAGKKVGIIGTEGIFYSNQVFKLNMTTPDPIELFYHLKNMQKQKVEFVVMEVSAHSIALKKINALQFYIKALTNITQDHLDFFEDITNYKNTKINFICKGKGIKIVNIDDTYGKQIWLKNKNVFTYSLNQKADIYCKDLLKDFSKLNLVYNNTEFELNNSLIGRFNIENILCASLIAKKIGLTDKDIIAGINNFKTVDGRLNLFKKGNKNCVVDFAHTPDALKKIIQAIKETTKNKVFVLFGCGGNRDKNKREQMGCIASEYADYVYITNDNPRFEEPTDIINQIKNGITKENYAICEDRIEAINLGIENLSDGDYLLICGKGAEDYIEIKGKKLPYSDIKVLENLGFKRIN